MIKFIKKIARYTLIAMFFSFYVIAILINYNHINHYLKPLELFHLKKEYKVDNKTYLSTFPTESDLKEYKEKYHIKRVIALLNYKLIISKELLQEEESICKKLGIELIYIPVPFFSKNPMDYMLIKNLLKEEPKVTLIHSYLFDSRMKILEKVLIYGKTP